ncbi:FtsK/SpoIIIE domain-containing protein, partial [Floridanema aerugineum]
TDTCHFLIGGTTGSGKTELLKAIIASIIWSYLPQQAQLIIVDPKRTKFNQFANLPWLYCPIVKDSKSAIGILADMASEMESRYELFEANGCENIEEYLQTKGIEIYIGWIVCLQEADRIKLEDDLIRQWEPEWNNVGKI